MSLNVLSVSQLNTYVKSIIESDDKLSNVFVEGEISNFKNHYSSGHLYFSLKDDNATVRCVMFNRSASRLRFKPEDTLKVICRGRISLYERDGQYQFYCEDMQPVGIGALALKYEQLKKKLASEGLFNPETKRPLPQFPRRIAVVTSETGAAVQDIISVTSRRMPLCELIMCPVTVQGEIAAPSMISMLDKIYSCDGIDLIIIGRGGGSFEDLFCFNDEQLVRKLYESPIPIISAVGHETDFTLCDFVADLRAPTPSAAAELAVPDIDLIKQNLKSYPQYFSDLLGDKIERLYERLDRCLQSPTFTNCTQLYAPYYDSLTALCSRFLIVSTKNNTNVYERFSTAVAKLDALNPLKVMARGFSAVRKDGEYIDSVKKLSVGDNVNIRFSDGEANAIITDF